jgi:hypothetical protein
MSQDEICPYCFEDVPADQYEMHCKTHEVDQQMKKVDYPRPIQVPGLGPILPPMTWMPEDHSGL